MNPNEVDQSALLDLYMYMDIQDVGFSQRTISDVLNSNTFQRQIKTEEQQRNYETLLNAAERDPTFARTVIIDQSMVNSEFPDTILIAGAFRSPGQEITVAYRGTGDGKWVDNGEGM
jgi:hypothetical protein